MKKMYIHIYNRRNVTTCAEIHSIYILSGDIQLDIVLLIQQITACDMNQNGPDLSFSHTYSSSLNI